MTTAEYMDIIRTIHGELEEVGARMRGDQTRINLTLGVNDPDTGDQLEMLVLVDADPDNTDGVVFAQVVNWEVNDDDGIDPIVRYVGPRHPMLDAVQRLFRKEWCWIESVDLTLPALDRRITEDDLEDAVDVFR